MTREGRIELGDITPHNIKQLKKLNTVVFPVSYNDKVLILTQKGFINLLRGIEDYQNGGLLRRVKFYKDVLEVGELAKLAYYNDIVVGAVCCRVDKSENTRRLYIMTLGCLAPYRRLGIGTKMLEHVLNICKNDGGFDSIYLHVQTSNFGARAFYEKFDFEIIETKKNYYKRIDPADAYVLQKTLRGPQLKKENHK